MIGQIELIITPNPRGLRHTRALYLVNKPLSVTGRLKDNDQG